MSETGKPVQGSAGRDDVRLARVALTEFVESGHRDLWSRVAVHGPVAVLEAVLAQRSGPRGVGPDQGPATDDLVAQARTTLARTHRIGARVVIPEDPEWPASLDQLAQLRGDRRDPLEWNTAPPLCLWVRGLHRLDHAVARAVAVVGARAATEYGTHLAREIGYGMVGHGWTVVSGGAYGIDAYGHRGALAGDGVTVAVLASGIDRAYPAGHASLFERIADTGLLVSEWAPGAAPYRHRFLIRNRVIAALSAGTVLVEANARSGARQTLRRAGQLRRARLVVPGPVTSAMSVGCHEELREPQTRLVASAAHILEEVGRIGADLAPVPRGPVRAYDRLVDPEKRLLEALTHRPITAAEAAAYARVPFSEAVRLLPGLADRGFARRADGGFVLGRAVQPPDHDQSDSDPAGRPGAPAGSGADDQDGGQDY